MRLLVFVFAAALLASAALYALWIMALHSIRCGLENMKEPPRPTAEEIQIASKNAEEEIWLFDKMGLRIKTPPYLQTVFSRVVAAEKGNRAYYRFRLVICYRCDIHRYGRFYAWSYGDGLVVLPAETIIELKNESELVGILGHEVGHVIHRDSGKEIALRKRIARIVWPFRGSALLWARAIEHTDYIEGQVNADQAGITALRRLGYDPCPMLAWEKKSLKKSAEKNIRIQALETELREPCGGKKFQTYSEPEFRNFQNRMAGYPRTLIGPPWIR